MIKSRNNSNTVHVLKKKNQRLLKTKEGGLQIEKVYSERNQNSHQKSSRTEEKIKIPSTVPIFLYKSKIKDLRSRSQSKTQNKRWIYFTGQQDNGSDLQEAESYLTEEEISMKKSIVQQIKAVTEEQFKKKMNQIELKFKEMQKRLSAKLQEEITNQIVYIFKTALLPNISERKI